LPIDANSEGIPPILRTLPLSGRRGAKGGVAEGLELPVHSRGLFDGSAGRKYPLAPSSSSKKRRIDNQKERSPEAGMQAVGGSAEENEIGTA